ncbi:MAG: 3-oxoacyl-ACP reductase FabG [Mariprofundales bacterium]
MSKKALVTGASRGIGKAIAIRLAAEGIHVWVNYLSNKQAADELIVLIEELGGSATTIQFDVGDQQACMGAMENLIEQEGAIDIIVHNAGISSDATFPGMKTEQWENVINTNLNSFYYVCKPLIMPMIRKRWGRIVSVSSVAALHGNRGQTNYAAAKAGLIGATRSLAKDVATRGICVNSVAPGFIATEMIDNIPIEIIKQSVPMARAGRVAEVAEVVNFLCSDGASYITGEVINVSGGII